MNRLEYCFDCLDGYYFFCAEWNETLNYEIESDIPGFENKSGELSIEETKAFEEALEKAGIERWERRYLPDISGIEDGIRWKLRLLKDEKEYVSQGEESFEPYGYECFMEGLKIMEEKADYFLAKGE